MRKDRPKATNMYTYSRDDKEAKTMQYSLLIISKKKNRRQTGKNTKNKHNNGTIKKKKNGVELVTGNGSTEKFDHVILACHSDQSLALLADADADEKSILGAIKYQPNQAILHTDPSFLPKRKIAHAAWNFHAGYGENADRPIAVTYLINKLQPLPFSRPVMVTLNPHREPNAKNVIQRLEYSHPLFDEAAIKAQRKMDTLQGRHHTWYCGAWTRYGFHEDGLTSGLRVASFFGAVSAWQQMAK